MKSQFMRIQLANQTLPKKTPIGYITGPFFVNRRMRRRK